jgi:CheY-like chemotaxis protein
VRKKILLVDDSKTARRLARMILGPTYDVIEAEDGAEALVKARAEAPGLILLDVAMPKCASGRRGPISPA